MKPPSSGRSWPKAAIVKGGCFGPKAAVQNSSKRSFECGGSSRARLPSRCRAPYLPPSPTCSPGPRTARRQCAPAPP